MRVGLTLLTDQPWAEAAPRWRATEELGFDHAWTYDHLTWGGLPDSPWAGATPTLAAAAAITERIPLGTLVSAPNFRHPYLLFRDAQALEDVSGGRFLLGLGTGGDLDAQVLGGADLSVRERVDRFQEFVGVLEQLRDGDHVTTEGRWFSTADARTRPGLPRTPYLLAANGPRSLRFAAAHGSGWITTGPYAADSVDSWYAGLAESVHRFDDALAEVGRDPGTVPRYVLPDATPHLTGTGRFALSSVAFFEEVAGRVAELGFTDLVTHWPRRETAYVGDEAVLEAVAADVLPGLQAG
ncbi:LLM class flavin-dependent oxidoreductase [Nocardioides lianchengensis]|uniref:Luciferase-like monooxygenase n=1 Tax=Nocardioides lianchengensis TaxID=1045774 RepID=A0A1G6M0Q3_9ACTN|nr:LLM class flavin-dependent oxidoreductase [Nocardioides lianchengensis]NYG12386.1 alkanesulfonate monooxygenase SsuD/methylene tetrahydromethanopterin reductase-like flavin-dependent oxidoreductase (luciferase family) [Nocardioides lianchengensis]SDC49128.1 Luciferase-like monooxygenase [Nocardioides lianchengensis]